jgi:dienelactone hydrolase
VLVGDILEDEDSMRLRTLWLCLLAGCSSPSTPAADSDDAPLDPCTSANSLCAERVEIGAEVYLPVFRTHSLAEGDDRITRGLIVVHGTNRNADDYFQRGYQAAADAGEQNRTIVVAPHFQTTADGPAGDEPFWSSGGWKRGHLSLSEGPSPRVSSYAAIDRVVALLSDRARFPGIKEIVVTGHSAGGQVVHRYAASSQAEQTAPDVTFRYVVANPSTYLYLRPERANAADFSVPEASVCPDFDDWHYGLEDRNTYARALESDSIVAQLTGRDVRILLGAADSLSASLDVSCGANLQGPYRLARGQTLRRFMDAFFPGHGHVESIVPGVGHSSADMWSSSVGLLSLFGS